MKVWLLNSLPPSRDSRSSWRAARALERKKSEKLPLESVKGKDFNMGNPSSEPGVVVHPFNRGTWEAGEADVCEFQASGVAEDAEKLL